MRGYLVTGAAAVLAASALAMAGPSAQAVTHHAGKTARPCASQVRTPARAAHIGGVTRAVSMRTGCAAHITSDPANGTPPLIWHGGPMMGTRSTGPVVMTPIFWAPAGHAMAKQYRTILTSYLKDVAIESGKHTNVFSTLTEYFGSNGAIHYKVKLGKAVSDSQPLPADGCTVEANDTTNIYADSSGYDSCIDDDQVIAETDRVVSSRHLPRDLAHIYVLFLPKHVESCFFAGSTATADNFCTVNHQPSAAYCAYHSQAPTGTVYANLAYPIYDSDTGFTCSSDAVYPDVQAPNGNPDADTEVSPTSHEIMEAITDPDTSTGWYDSSGFENGDECAYVFGQTQGSTGALYNQVIHHHHYLTQEEFSNRDFALTGGGCLQSE